MPKFEVGEKIERTWDGRKGVIRDIEEHGFTQHAYRIKWYEGGEDWETEDKLLPA